MPFLSFYNVERSSRGFGARVVWSCHVNIIQNVVVNVIIILRCVTFRLNTNVPLASRCVKVGRMCDIIHAFTL